MPVNDPVMAVVDKLPLASRSQTEFEVSAAGQERPTPFGLRFAVTPAIPPGDKHKKTYYTVTVKEATQISSDGKVKTIQDDVQKERAD